jgi:putative ABC transport system substrate-binding protein
MANIDFPAAVLEMREAQKASSILQLEANPVEFRHSEDIAPAFQSIKDRVDALYVCIDPLVGANINSINAMALASRLPTIHGLREYVTAGGLMSYGTSIPVLFRRSAELVDQLLRGAKPGNIPVEQPTNFILVINLKTAHSLGITIPSTLLATADEVIE